MDKDQLRELMISCATEARKAHFEGRGGMKTLAQRSDLPEFFCYLLEGILSHSLTEESMEDMRFQLKAMLLILEGNQIDVIDLVLRTESGGVGDFFYWAINEPEKIEQFRKE